MTRSTIWFTLGIVLGLMIAGYTRAPQGSPGETFTSDRRIGADR